MCPLNISHWRPLNIPYETLLQVAGGRFLVASNRTARLERPIRETRAKLVPKVSRRPLLKVAVGCHFECVRTTFGMAFGNFYPTMDLTGPK